MGNSTCKYKSSAFNAYNLVYFCSPVPLDELINRMVKPIRIFQQSRNVPKHNSLLWKMRYCPNLFLQIHFQQPSMNLTLLKKSFTNSSFLLFSAYTVNMASPFLILCLTW